MTIIINDYNPAWPKEFEVIRSALREILGSLALRIDHIGSTAVPGLGAKDVIDIQITVQELTSEVRQRLIEAGYEFWEVFNRDHVPLGADGDLRLWSKFFFYDLIRDAALDWSRQTGWQPINKYILTGAPGGGKTTVINLLESAGYKCKPESARKIIKARLAQGQSPRPGEYEFANEILKMDINNYDESNHVEDLIFFDRGIVDALGMLFDCNGMQMFEVLKHLELRPHSKTVFLFPAWEAIYKTDSERDQTIAEAIKVENRIAAWYERLNFKIVQVPFAAPIDRMNFILSSGN